MSDRSQGVSRSPMHLLHQAEQAAGKLFSAKGKVFVTPRQLAVLVAVAESEGLNQTDVMQRTRIDRSTVADIVQRLVRKGALQRRRSWEDSRALLPPSNRNASTAHVGGWQLLVKSSAHVACEQELSVISNS
jgi:hypothetical protein